MNNLRIHKLFIFEYPRIKYLWCELLPSSQKPTLDEQILEEIKQIESEHGIHSTLDIMHLDENSWRLFVCRGLD